MSRIPIVSIEWQDAFANTGWFDEDSLEKWVKELSYCIDVGVLLEETPEYIMFAPHLRLSLADKQNRQEKQWGGLHKIPKTWLRARRVLGYIDDTTGKVMAGRRQKV